MYIGIITKLFINDIVNPEILINTLRLNNIGKNKLMHRPRINGIKITARVRQKCPHAKSKLFFIAEVMLLSSNKIDGTQNSISINAKIPGKTKGTRTIRAIDATKNWFNISIKYFPFTLSKDSEI